MARHRIAILVGSLREGSINRRIARSICALEHERLDCDIVQIGVRFFERYDDADIAVVVAHELAHNILRHRARLDAAGISRGLFAEVGRNGRLIRRTEDEADLLGLHLLRNAGYDPASAPRFWRDHGGDVDGGLHGGGGHRGHGRFRWGGQTRCFGRAGDQIGWGIYRCLCRRGSRAARCARLGP